jgi:hypothetical protein
MQTSLSLIPLFVLVLLAAGCAPQSVPPPPVTYQAPSPVPYQPPAAPKPQPTAPSTQNSPWLSPAETLCQAYGAFVYNRALERDQGTTLFEALSASRQWDATHAVVAEIRQAHERALRAVYQAPGVSPKQLQQYTEAVCLTEMTPTNTATPRGGTQRY